MAIRHLAIALTVAAAFGASGCTALSGFGGGGTAGLTGSWTCTGGARLTVRAQDGMLAVTDSRGFSVSLPPDPPGQAERFAKTGYALVFAGRSASWFAAGQTPADCRR